MRRSDREITDFDDILAVLRRCDVCRVAFFDGAYPYIVPMNFGVTAEGGETYLWFHCAAEGKKLELLRRDAHVAFEADCSHELFLDADAAKCTMAYESVMGRGKIEVLPEAKKAEALDILMRRYRPEGDFHINPAILPQTAALRLHVREITGKRHIKK